MSAVPNTLALANTGRDLLERCVSTSKNRIDLWASFLHKTGARTIAEIGVYQGEYAAAILESCDLIHRYYMIDPWRHLDGWNKPANQDDSKFEEFFETTKARTEFAAQRRIILRGKTSEVIDRIPDGSLDFAYIDGDHTLRGIVIDLHRVYPKVRAGGFVGGDDFCRSIWQHPSKFEPTLVFPFAVYFAEAVGATIYALPYNQFCLHKTAGEFRFIDLAGEYENNLSLRAHCAPEKMLKLAASERFPAAARMARRLKALLP